MLRVRILPGLPNIKKYNMKYKILLLISGFCFGSAFVNLIYFNIIIFLLMFSLGVLTFLISTIIDVLNNDNDDKFV